MLVWKTRKGVTIIIIFTCHSSSWIPCPRRLQPAIILPIRLHTEVDLKKIFFFFFFFFFFYTISAEVCVTKQENMPDLPNVPTQHSLATHFVLRAWCERTLSSLVGNSQEGDWNWVVRLFLFCEHFSSSFHRHLLCWWGGGLRICWLYPAAGVVRPPSKKRNVLSMTLIWRWGSSSGWVGFYGISTTAGYLMPNLLYTYRSNIYDLVWLGFMADKPL